MHLRTLAWLLGLAASMVGSLFRPLLGVIGYMSEYVLCPGAQWWGRPVRRWTGFRRYSFTLGLLIAIGMLLNRNTLRYGKKLLMRQEWLIVLFIALVWMSSLLGEKTVGRYSFQDHPRMKITKIVIFMFMLSHLITRTKDFNVLMWTLVVLAFALGHTAWTIPRREFITGRLESVGSADFMDANHFGAFMAAMLALVGAQFLRCKWIGKGLCLISGAFTANAVILARSRGSTVGLMGGGIVALFLSPKRHRLKVAAFMIVGFAGFMYLTDPYFIKRMGTIFTSEREQDSSSRNRIEIWEGSLKMLAANPIGVGPGNFYQAIGRYAPTQPGMDAHNTLVRCWGEMGFPGITVFILMLTSIMLSLRRILRRARDLPQPIGDKIRYAGFGIAVSLVTFLGCGLTTTVLYIEGFWWVVALPLCLERVTANAEEDLLLAPAREAASKKAGPRFRRPPRRTGAPVAGARR